MVAASAALVAVGVVAGFATPDRMSEGPDAWGAVSFVAPVAAFSVVGGLIALRRPENLIGWLLAVIGLLFAIVLACSAVSKWGLETGDLSKGVAEWISVGGSVWVIALGLVGTQLPLRLPDGRLPSPRSRWFSRISIALIAITLVGMATQRGRVEDVPGSANPLGSAWAWGLAPELTDSIHICDLAVWPSRVAIGSTGWGRWWSNTPCWAAERSRSTAPMA